ncbi:MAG: sucrose synthase [Deltaproteobacteria bacterium]|nr:sucrose synthase [Deltaproteobacteria bacterium]MBW2153213.1 sucrose synthase [Deltaproteobacteria bacterium]
MKNLIPVIITKNNKKDFKEIVFYFTSQKERIFVRNDIIQLFRQYCDVKKKTNKFREYSSIFTFLKRVQELFVCEDHIFINHRYAMGKYRFYLLSLDGEQMEEIDLLTYLNSKDYLATHKKNKDNHLRLDFMPFYDFSPSIRDIRTIGNGIRFLNRFMSSNIFSRPREWNKHLFEFIKLHKYNEQQLLVNGSLIKDFETLIEELEKILRWLKKKNPEASYKTVEVKLKKSGFESGWGNTVQRAIETMQILLDLINEPRDELLEEFISRVPMPLISKIAIISPHGWFGQTNVLGKPDTGGQVIYILDQVRALERHLFQEIQMQGLEVKPKIIVVTRLIPEAEGTTCNKKKEKIFHTDNSWILRIPFRDRQYNTVKHWISRFKIWPYLENFAQDAFSELTSEFQGRPDLIIGNYSDGNLVASLLSDRFDVIQCTIAHALEMTKYSHHDLFWQEKEEDYHFSLQFTADLFSMNKSDFIITSTNQEIIGTEDTIGQYEAYLFFTLPELYQVTNGINLFAPKFNVIPPGVDETLYFPYYQTEHRIENNTKKWEKRLFTEETDDICGSLDHPDKPAIFTMARLDKIKNITGLIEAYGMSKKLQKEYNLIFAAGTIHIEASKDMEERKEISKVYRLLEQYNLYGSIRWLPSINKGDTGEVYRIIAGRRGIFVQPALFEAFGLTVIEAMASGLPTFAPKFGGGLEIIEHGKSGFLLNTSKPELIAKSLESFLDCCRKDDHHWQEISQNGIERVQKNYNWNTYSQRLINLTKLYGFWRYAVSGPGMLELDRYCDLIYYFLIKQRAEMIV